MPGQPGVAGGLPLPFQAPGQAPAGPPQVQMQPQSGLNVPGTVVPQALMARPLPMPQMSNTMVAPAEMVDNGATNADAPTVAVPQAMR